MRLRVFLVEDEPEEILSNLVNFLTHPLRSLKIGIQYVGIEKSTELTRMCLPPNERNLDFQEARYILILLINSSQFRRLRCLPEIGIPK